MGFAETCVSGLILSDAKLVFAIASVSLSVAALLAIKYLSVSSRARLGLIYTHLGTLFFPAILFTTHVACTGMNLACSQGFGRLFIYSVTATAALTGVAGFFIIPALYHALYRQNRVSRGWMHSFVRKHVLEPLSGMPRIYLLNSARPVAFSFKAIASSIFISVGMLDILSRKETEAVLLHEIGHIRNRSSVMKVSSMLLKFSPLSFLAHFGPHGIEEEERLADRFASDIQGTKRHVVSAKRKITRFLEERRYNSLQGWN